MAFIRLSSQGLYYPPYMVTQAMPQFASLLIDATGEKVACSGRVWFPARTGTKNIQRVGFRFGTVTKASGSGLTVSLQDVDLATGPPMQPDGTQDQTVAVANGDSNFASNTWCRTGTLSATRSVTYGDRVSVVIEYDGGGRLGSDAVNISVLASVNTNIAPINQVQVLNTGSWAAQSCFSNVVLEFDDGTFGCLDGTSAYIVSAFTNHTFNSGTGGADEYALQFRLPFAAKVDGIWAFVNPSGSSADYELLLYSGTTALQTVTVDCNAIFATGAGRPSFVPIPETQLTINTDYLVAIRPTTANNITAYSYDVFDANHFSVTGADVNAVLTTRLDQGSWAAVTTTRRLFAGVRISSLDDGAGSSGGLLVHPGMAGGMRG